jgi:hypothetical protein
MGFNFSTLKPCVRNLKAMSFNAEGGTALVQEG